MRSAPQSHVLKMKASACRDIKKMGGTLKKRRRACSSHCHSVPLQLPVSGLSVSDVLEDLKEDELRKLKKSYHFYFFLKISVS